MATSGVKDTDKGWKRIMDAFSDLSSAFVTVGIHGDADPYVRTADNPDPPPVAVVASKHEYGDGVPQRAFLRPTVDANRGEYATIEGKVIGKVIDGTMKLDQALGIVGIKVAVDVKQAITDLDSPPLAESTIERKVAKASYLSASKQQSYKESGANPLIDTGHMRQSVTYDVRINGVSLDHPKEVGGSGA